MLTYNVTRMFHVCWTYKLWHICAEMAYMLKYKSQYMSHISVFRIGITAPWNFIDFKSFHICPYSHMEDESGISAILTILINLYHFLVIFLSTSRLVVYVCLNYCYRSVDKNHLPIMQKMMILLNWKWSSMQLQRWQLFHAYERSVFQYNSGLCCLY